MNSLHRNFKIKCQSYFEVFFNGKATFQRTIHALNKKDPERRLEFCDRLLAGFVQGAQFPPQIVWNIKATFNFKRFSKTPQLHLLGT